MQEYLGKFYSVKTQRARDRKAVKRLGCSEKHELSPGGISLVSVQQRRKIPKQVIPIPRGKCRGNSQEGPGELRSLGTSRQGSDI